MNDLSIIMPVIGAIGASIIIVVTAISKTVGKRAGVKGIDAEAFIRFAEEIKRENAEIKKDLHTIKEKVEAIDGMMKDI